MKMPSLLKALWPFGRSTGSRFGRGGNRGAGALGGLGGRGGWWPIVRESFAGAWQQNVEIRFDSVLANSTVFACQTLIASDISKLRLRLVAQDANGIWTETTNPAYSPVLRKPNSYQNRIQFFENWALSKLQYGNTYVLKGRDARSVVTRLWILDPLLVMPLVADSGEVFYELRADVLSGIEEQVIVPAREIIHDRYNCFFHPLVGLSPIFANGLAAMTALAIQNNSADFFANGSTVPGILTAPGAIADETAARLKDKWETNYGGKNNIGKIAVLGDGLKFEAMAVKAIDAQLIDQLKWTAETICSTYHVPPYKVGIGAQPTYNNVQALNTEYYSQCLQAYLEAIELALDEGLATGDYLGTEFDLDGLLRMDSATLIKTVGDGIGAGALAPNEARLRLNLGPVAGGGTPYLQQQNYSLAALAKRDASDDPFGKTPAPAAEPSPEPPANDNADAEAKDALIEILKGLA